MQTEYVAREACRMAEEAERMAAELAPGAADPLFAAIEAHRNADVELVAAEDARDMAGDAERHSAAEQANRQAFQALLHPRDKGQSGRG
jgi:hypothetical protein